MQKLHSAIRALVTYRKELSSFTGSVAKSAAVLSTCEEHTGLSRALSQLADVEVDIFIQIHFTIPKSINCFFRKKSNCCDPSKPIPISTYCRKHWRITLDFSVLLKMCSTNVSRYSISFKYFFFIFQFTLRLYVWRFSKIGNMLNFS